MQNSLPLIHNLSLAIAVLALAGATAMAADAAKKPGADEKKKVGDPVVFTNKSLDGLPPLPAPTAVGHDAIAPSPSSPSADGDGGVVITNETLEKLFGPSEVAPPPGDDAKPAAPGSDAGAGASKAPPVDPLAAMQQEKEEAQKRQDAQGAAQQDVAKAEASVRELEQRLLAQHNPFLPRPKLTPEEQAKEQPLDGVERVRRTQEQLDLAKKELERARQQAGQAEPLR